jgi:diguanylate cyclase (GGDEF)-like protein/PAS domain S-box-containing protein
MRQLFAERPGRAVLPFSICGLAALGSLLLPPYDPGAERLAIVIVAIVVSCALVGLLIVLPNTHWAVAVPPLAFFAAIGIARDASGGAASGLAPMVLLPVLWFVLYGTRLQLRLSAVATAIVFFGPLIVVRGPRYDPADWRRGAIWTLIVALVGPALQRVVERQRVAVAEKHRLAGQLTSVLRAATEHSIIATDLEGTITLFSEGAEQMLGYRADEVVGIHTPELLHDPDEIGAQAARFGIAAGFDVFGHDVPEGGAHSGNWTYRRRDSSTVRVHLTISRLLDDLGVQQGWIGIARDITAEELALQELAVAEQRWRQLLDHLPDTSVLVVGPGMEYRVAVGAGLVRQGMDGVAGKTLYETSSPANIALLEPIFVAALHDKVTAVVELRSSVHDHVLEMIVAPLAEHVGDPEALVVARDVTEARQRELEVALARDRFELLFNQTPHGTMLADCRGIVTHVNHALCAMLAKPASEIVGRSVQEIYPEDAAQPSQLADLLSGKVDRVDTERTLTTGGADPLHVAVTATGLRNAGGQVGSLLVAVVDVSESRRLQAQLAHLADHDPLTSLANRRMFDAELTAHLSRCRRYGAAGALMLLDLDGFKQVNDALGHDAGDQLMVAVAQALRRRMREVDIVARLGGDEFAILLPVADRAIAEKVALDIVELVRTQVSVSDGTGFRTVTASVGVVLILDSDVTPLMLVRAADDAMYEAKDAGRDRYVFHDTSQLGLHRTGEVA